MAGRIIELSQNGYSLHLERGFLAVREGGETVGRVPVDDIDAVIATAQGVSWSNRSLAALTERGGAVVILAKDFTPAAMFLPAAGHHNQARRMRAQADASKPTRKRLWAELVKAKIGAQGDALERLGHDAMRLKTLRAEVRSGDPDNREALAAQYYWPRIMGKDFRRERAEGGANAMLNYGYAVLRASAARAIVAAGLHPTLSLHHISDGDALALADDVMEPFRPAVDLTVRSLIDAGAQEVDKDVKAALTGTLVADIRTENGRTPVSHAMVRLCQNMAGAFLGERRDLGLPASCLPLEAELDL